MEFRKLILLFIITIISLTTIMFGVSYGWYAYSNAESVVEGTTIKETPTVIFSQTEFLSASNIIPIEDDDRYTYAKKNSFNITLNENLKGYNVGIEIVLVDIKISNELKNINYKYELVQNNKTISVGDFSLLGDSKELILLPMTIMEPDKYPKNYNYQLYVWLSDDKTDQNELMNKTFSGRIKVNSAIKR